jgi:hypothetical protein
MAPRGQSTGTVISNIVTINNISLLLIKMDLREIG